MIEGYIGKPGTGKTYTLTCRVLRSYKRYWKVAANLWIDVPNLVELKGPEDLLTLEAPPGKKILVVIDEAHLWLPSRMSMKLPASLLMRLSQTRKAGWDLWWSAQHETRVDRVLRDVTNWMWLCRGWLAGFALHSSGPLIFTAKCYEPEKFRKPKKGGASSLRFYRRKIGESYDTFESIEVASHVAAVKDHYSGAAKTSPARRLKDVSGQ